MTFPICDSCASSGMLCSGCEKKVRDGQLSELEVLVSSLLCRHGVPGYRSLVELDNKLVIFASDDEARAIIGPGGRTVAEISQKLGRRIVVLVPGWDKELIIKSLARPSKVVAVNRIFKEGGEEVLKLIFDKPLDEGTVRLMKELAGDMEIEYEENPYVRGAKR